MTQTLSAVSPITADSRKQAFSKLRCRECGAEYEPVAKHVCELCFGPLEVAYDYDRLKRTVT
ncbi:MAG: hypothetical protein Q6K80_08965, partial [Thermostichus sp. DG_1_6_bins_120]